MSDLETALAHISKAIVSDGPAWLNHRRRFEHDCLWCVFIGQEGEYDLYYCPQNGFPTVLARYGDDGGDYLSGMPVATTPGFRYCLDVARERARSLGFPLTPDEIRAADTTVSGYALIGGVGHGPMIDPPDYDTYCNTCAHDPCICNQPPHEAEWLSLWRAGEFDDDLMGFDAAEFVVGFERVVAG